MMTKTLTLTFALTLMAVATAGAAHAATIFVHNASGETIRFKYQTRASIVKKEWKTVSIDSNSRKKVDTVTVDFKYFYINGDEHSVKELKNHCLNAHLIFGDKSRVRMGHRGTCE